MFFKWTLFCPEYFREIDTAVLHSLDVCLESNSLTDRSSTNLEATYDDSYLLIR
jgi:hypothetical protein